MSSRDDDASTIRPSHSEKRDRAPRGANSRSNGVPLTLRGDNAMVQMLNTRLIAGQKALSNRSAINVDSISSNNTIGFRLSRKRASIRAIAVLEEILGS